MSSALHPGRTVRIVAGIASLCTADFLVAADPPAPGNTGPRRQRIEIVRGTQVSPGPSDVGSIDTQPAPIDRTHERRLLAQAERTAADLTADSVGAFNRGLMPLRDYLEQTSIVLTVDLMSADANGSSQVGVWAQQVERLSDASRRLNLLNQPAAEGWASDAALAEWALADAHYHLAIAKHDGAAQQEAARQRADWAAEYARRREFDVSIGAAPESSLARAVGQFASSEQDLAEPGSEQASQDLRAEYLSQLSKIDALTREWAEKGAGIGRTDRVQEAAIAVDLERITSRDAQGNLVINPEPLQAADSRLQDLFAAQRDFYSHGTAKLYDLSRTWTVWRNLHTLAATEPNLLSDEQRSARSDALETLQEMAAQTDDLRGRNAADVTYVDLLTQLDAVDAAQTEQRRSYLN